MCSPDLIRISVAARIVLREQLELPGVSVAFHSEYTRGLCVSPRVLFTPTISFSALYCPDRHHRGIRTLECTERGPVRH